MSSCTLEYTLLEIQSSKHYRYILFWVIENSAVFIVWWIMGVYFYNTSVDSSSKGIKIQKLNFLIKFLFLLRSSWSDFLAKNWMPVFYFPLTRFLFSPIKLALNNWKIDGENFFHGIVVHHLPNNLSKIGWNRTGASSPISLFLPQKQRFYQ